MQGCCSHKQGINYNVNTYVVYCNDSTASPTCRREEKLLAPIILIAFFLTLILIKMFRR